ncbi:MAG: hypothetical protein ABI551_11260 [Polyangiaceae bacterium]
MALTLAIVAALWELRTEKIPNALCVVGLAAGACLIVVDSALVSHGEGFFVGFTPAVALYRRGYLGGGATKWLGVVGWMVGLHTTLLMWPVLLSAAAVLFVHHRVRNRSNEPVNMPSAPVILVAALIATLVDWPLR